MLSVFFRDNCYLCKPILNNILDIDPIGLYFFEKLYPIIVVAAKRNTFLFLVIYLLKIIRVLLADATSIINYYYARFSFFISLNIRVTIN